FSHIGFPPIPLKREAATSTGCMLTQATKHPPNGVPERYPKTSRTTEGNTEKREYPFSVHDNRFALHRTSEMFDVGLGRRKVLDGLSQHSSHNFFLWAQDAVPLVSVDGDGMSFYHTEYLGCQETDRPSFRRFPQNHAQMSSGSAAQAGRDLVWFGRHDRTQHTPLSVLAVTQFPSSSKPWNYSYRNKSYSNK
ncbi:TEX36 protein, partial [Atractosteus spatula]|nr:TEX36 protein [Atractosteus spatula]